MYDLRKKGDYGDLYEYDEKIVKPLIEQVKQFIEELKKII
jgi:uncharacterized protein (UPF0332 family)